MPSEIKNPNSQVNLEQSETLIVEPEDTAHAQTKIEIASENKQYYLNHLNRDSYQLTAADLRPIKKHYEQKNHIKIYINGDHASSQAIILKKQAILDEEIIGLKDETLKYALYIQKHWLGRGYVSSNDLFISNMVGSKFKESFNEMEKLFSSYLTSKGALKDNLSWQELMDLNQLATKFAPIFEDLIPEYIQALNDFCLNRSEVIQELKRIQKESKPGELVGYIWTNNRRVDARHFEVFLISKESIIKPVSWSNLGGGEGLSSEDLPGMFDTKLKSFVKSDSFIPCPQSQNVECGTLGMMYLNELLKDNALQLKEYCLQCPYYEKDNLLGHFFFPSPQVLRFSQSGAYNELIKAMLCDSVEEVVTHGEKKYVVKTLRRILEESISSAKEYGNKEVELLNQRLLDNLPSFRIRWLEAYALSDQKRSLMDNGHNYYLAYTTQRMKNKKNESVAVQDDLESKSPPLTLNASTESIIASLSTQKENHDIEQLDKDLSLRDQDHLVKKELISPFTVRDEGGLKDNNPIEPKLNFTPLQLKIINEAMQCSLDNLGKNLFVNGRDEKKILLTILKKEFEQADNSELQQWSLQSFIKTASTARHGFLNFFPAVYGQTRSAKAFMELIASRDQSLLDILKDMSEDTEAIEYSTYQ